MTCVSTKRKNFHVKSLVETHHVPPVGLGDSKLSSRLVLKCGNLNMQIKSIISVTSEEMRNRTRGILEWMSERCGMRLRWIRWWRMGSVFGCSCGCGPLAATNRNDERSQSPTASAGIRCRWRAGFRPRQSADFPGRGLHPSNADWSFWATGRSGCAPWAAVCA